MKWFLLPNGIFQRMFLWITVAIVILLSTLSAILYIYYNRTSVEMIKQANLKALSQISYSIDYMNENARNFVFSIIGDPFVTHAMYGDEFDWGESYSDLGRLKQLVNTNSFIHSMYIYNRKLAMFVPIMGTSDGEVGPTLDIGLQEFIDSYSETAPKFVPIPRQISVDTSSAGSSLPQTSKVYTYVAYEHFSAARGIEGAVIVNVKADYLKAMIHSLDESAGQDEVDGSMTFIVDADGVVVSGVDSQVLQALGQSSILPRIAANGEGAGNFIGRMAGHKVIVAHVTADAVRWTLVKLTPTALIDKQAKSVQWIVLVVCAIIVCLGLAVSFWLSRRLATPFQKLVGQARGQLGKGAAAMEQDEVALLFQAFSETSTKAKLLDSIERDLLHRRRNDWLQHWLSSGNQGFEEMKLAMEKLKIPLRTEQPYRIVLLKIDRYALFANQFSERDRVLFRYAICDVAREVLGAVFHVQAVDMGEDTVAVIMNSPGLPEDAQRQRISQPIQEIQQWSILNLKLELTAAVSSMSEDWEEADTFFQEASNTAKSRLVYGHGAILWSDMVQEDAGYRMSAREEKRLLDSLIHGRLEEALEGYGQFVSKLSQYSYDTIHSALLMLAYAIYNSAPLAENASSAGLQFDLGAFASSIGSAETLAQMNQKYEELFIQLTAKAIVKPKRNLAFANTVKSVIESSYADKSLCLDSISTQLNFSKVYVGKIFRDVHGMSVADYITDYRLKKVVELLDQGNQQVSEILERVGIENKNYFYKVFKAKLGISLSEYKTSRLPELANPEKTGETDGK